MVLEKKKKISPCGYIPSLGCPLPIATARVIAFRMQAVTTLEGWQLGLSEGDVGCF